MIINNKLEYKIKILFFIKIQIKNNFKMNKKNGNYNIQKLII